MFEIYRNLGPQGPPKSQRRRKGDNNKAEKLRSQFLEHLAAPDWADKLTPSDVVLFWRECFLEHHGHLPARESFPRCMAVAKQLLDSYGARETLQIIACSFYEHNTPTSMGWYQSGYLSGMLEKERYSYLKMVSVELVRKMKRKYMTVEVENGRDKSVPSRTVCDQQGDVGGCSTISVGHGGRQKLVS